MWVLLVIVAWYRSRPAEIAPPEFAPPVEVPAWPGLSSGAGELSRAWSDANEAVAGWVSRFFGSVGGFLGNVVTYLVGGLFDALTFIGNGLESLGWSTLILVRTVAETLIHEVNVALGAIESTIAAMEDQIIAVSNLAGDVLNMAETLVNQARAEAYRIVRSEVALAIDGFEAILPGLVDGIVRPVIDGIEAEVGRVIDGLDGIVRDAIDALDLQRLVTDALAAAGIATAIASILEWIRECGEPTCQLAGPKTDLGKLLKLVNVAEWAALFALLGTMTEDDFERLARQIVAMATGSAESFVQAFIEDGRTLGGAAGDLIGGL